MILFDLMIAILAGVGGFYLAQRGKEDRQMGGGALLLAALVLGIPIGLMLIFRLAISFFDPAALVFGGDDRRYLTITAFVVAVPFGVGYILGLWNALRR